MNIKECFEVLELQPDATQKEVQKAYRIIMMATHPDKVQGDPRLKTIAERRAKEINVAREEVIAYLNDCRTKENPHSVNIGGGENYGKVSDFFNKICRITGADGAYHLDIYMAYRAWCAEKDLDAISMEDLKNALDAHPLAFIRRNINGIDSIYWPGIVISDAYRFDDYDDPWTFDPHVDGMPREFTEKEYADVDDDDDLGEVVF